MIEQRIRQKIENLVERAREFAREGGLARSPHDTAHSQRWFAEALNVIELAIPQVGNAYRRRIEASVAHTSGGTLGAVKNTAEIFAALLTDIDAGLLGDLRKEITANVFDDFLDHAVAYLKQSRKIEAGVIAGVVFEDTCRRIFRDKIGDDKDRALEDIINALARQGLITGQQSKQAKVAAHVRTKATHAQWDEFDLQGVADTIQITKLFLAEHLGG